MAETEQTGVMSLTVTLLSAYFANNTVPSSELPALVEGTRRALLGDTAAIAVPAEAKTEIPVAEAPKPEASEAAATVSKPVIKPAVTVEASLASPDHIISLIDGKPYKALKRHLSTHGLTPAEYRARYDLPADYPMVAPGYSAARREVALKLGLGGKRKSVTSTAVPGAEAAPASEPVPSPEPVAAAETASEKSAPVRAAREKAKTVTAAPPPVKVKRKAGSRKAQPAVAKSAPKAKQSPTPKAVAVEGQSAEAAPKPRRSRATKVGAAPVAPVEAAPAEASADVPATV